MLAQDLCGIVLDVETTGLNPKEGEGICEIAALKIHKGEVVDVFSCLVKPPKPIPALISSLTGITNLMVKESPSFATIAGDFLNFIGGLPLFAYNVSFDAGFINTELAACGRGEIKNVLVDILFLCRKLFARRLGRFSLKEVAEFLNIKLAQRHRALADAKAAAAILRRVLTFLEKRGIDNMDLFLSLFAQAHYRPLYEGSCLKTAYAAVAGRRRVRIKYFSYSSLSFLDLAVLPLRVEEHEGRSYLIARYSAGREEKAFGINRITEITLV